ncbi:Alpha/Beta hydrolase protein [Schizothecium vesticola]|uniref:Carboxylic ester hydrolase n=1 Tax=Schizothecium vesticola TaxID=314040 RepID=A0AA40F4J4_9PEZI|nr:Alpha/Beta hydrolase protein [Schizothecium vesticola]
MSVLVAFLGILLHLAGWIQLASSSSTSPPQVTVRNGTYEGIYSAEFDQHFFLGIPYAQDTGGRNRFRLPQPLDTRWAGIRRSTHFSHACPGATPDGDDQYGMSENCLSINIVRPAHIRQAAATKLPVMLYIHGGSYQMGFSSWDRYNLSFIVQHSVGMDQPVVAATINYRKAGWGFLNSDEIQSSGNTNLALRDMRQALHWVQENIASFGGDPERVIIWGESSGSFAVGQLLLSYGGRTDGLFHGTIQESGSATTAWYNGTDWYQPIYNNLVAKANCSDHANTLECLRAVPYSSLYPLLSGPGAPKFYPTVDGDIIPDFPTALLKEGRFAHMPHILGTNSDEGTDNAPRTISTDAQLRALLTHSGYHYPPAVIDALLSLYPDDPAAGIPLNTPNQTFHEYGRQYKRVAAILGDLYYHAPRLHDARHYARHEPDRTYVYRFNTRACGALADPREGVAHATELAFVFGNPRWCGPWPGYRELSANMMTMWINFAYYGSPNGISERGKGVVWPPYVSGGEEGRNMVLQTEEKGGCFVEADTFRLEGRELLTKWAFRRHV